MVVTRGKNGISKRKKNLQFHTGKRSGLLIEEDDIPLGADGLENEDALFDAATRATVAIIQVQPVQAEVEKPAASAEEAKKEKKHVSFGIENQQEESASTPVRKLPAQHEPWSPSNLSRVSTEASSVASDQEKEAAAEQGHVDDERENNVDETNSKQSAAVSISGASSPKSKTSEISGRSASSSVAEDSSSAASSSRTLETTTKDNTTTTPLSEPPPDSPAEQEEVDERQQNAILEQEEADDLLPPPPPPDDDEEESSTSSEHNKEVVSEPLQDEMAAAENDSTAASFGTLPPDEDAAVALQDEDDSSRSGLKNTGDDKVAAEDEEAKADDDDSRKSQRSDLDLPTRTVESAASLPPLPVAPDEENEFLNDDDDEEEEEETQQQEQAQRSPDRSLEKLNCEDQEELRQRSTENSAEVDNKRQRTPDGEKSAKEEEEEQGLNVEKHAVEATSVAEQQDHPGTTKKPNVRKRKETEATSRDDNDDSDDDSAENGHIRKKQRQSEGKRRGEVSTDASSDDDEEEERTRKKGKKRRKKREVLSDEEEEARRTKAKETSKGSGGNRRKRVQIEEPEGESVKPTKGGKGTKKKTSKLYRSAFSPKGIPADRSYSSSPVAHYLPKDDDEEEPELDQNGNTVRRSTRARFPPLEWWKGEHVVYGHNDFDPNKYEGVHSMAVPVSICKAKPTPYKPRKAVSRTAKARQQKSKQKKKQTAVATPDQEAPEWDSRKLRQKYRVVDGRGARIYNEDTEMMSHQNVVSYANELEFSQMGTSRERPQADRKKGVGSTAMCFNVAPGPRFPGYVMGQLVLPPGAIKDVESVGYCVQTYFVLDCQPKSLELAIGDPGDVDATDPQFDFFPETAQRFLLSKGEIFRVKPGNIYRLENHSKLAECALSWTIIQEAKADNSDDEQDDEDDVGDQSSREDKSGSEVDSEQEQEQDDDEEEDN